MKGLFRLGMFGAMVNTAAMALAQAQFFSLNDNGSSVRMVRNGSNASLVDQFSVAGSPDQVSEHSWWIRQASDTSEQRLGSLSTPLVTITGPNSVQFGWTRPDLLVTLKYVLLGSASGAELSETLSLTNTSATGTQISLFSYSDFDLGDLSGDDVASIAGSQAVVQTDELFVATSSSATAPTFQEVAGFPDLLVRLLDGDVDNFGSGLTSFTGDATFGKQWNLSLAASDSVVLHQSTRLDAVPEPATVGALLLGFGFVLNRRRVGRKP